jgi:hypothetical protein
MFYQEGEGGLPRYKMTRPIDLVKIKQTHPLYANFGQPFLEWEGIKYVDLFAKASALVSFGELGLEWEDMRTGIFLRVYDGMEVVPSATVHLGNQQATTNQDGMAEFFDLDANQLYDYEISHPDFEGISKGTILIPEEEREFIPVRIYNNPWDSFVKGRGIQPSFGNISTLWHQVEFEKIQAKASGVKTHASLQSILWVEIES